ncbi:MAG: hypothetical protein LBD89_06310 [Tannerellaceae bacterium]|jgi:hypothetical protein|nr:hypothetical protein [Tannerellaceae bacterium]
MAKRLEITFTKVILLMALLFPFSAAAQEKAGFGISAGADFVSSYVWRGIYQTGVAIQPGVTMSAGNFSLGVWGSTDFSTWAKEFDIALGYEAGAFSFGLTDYWWAGEGSPYRDYANSHFLEGNIGFNFGESLPLSLSWSTMFGYNGDKDVEDQQQYSTFITAGYDFRVKDVAFTAGIGISPWTGLYHKAGTEGFVLSTLSLKAMKEIKITDSFTLPVFVETIIAPNQDNVFLVFGISL